jgi:hypothetical protein
MGLAIVGKEMLQLRVYITCTCLAKVKLTMMHPHIPLLVKQVNMYLKWGVLDVPLEIH